MGTVVSQQHQSCLKKEIIMNARITTLDLPALNRATVGFDRLFSELERQFANSTSGTYPPYNIVQTSDDEYIISVAVAGFSMDDLAITKDKNILRIEGTSPKVEEDVTYLHKGIGTRNFRREFPLADHVDVVSASLQLGMLNVNLKREVPEELQPKRIEINAA
jgi:molecular chaperone IbpA